jgi:integrase/recombinase XerD
LDNQAYIEKFIAYLKLKGYTARTIEGYQNNLRQFQTFLAARRQKIPNLTHAELQEYRSYLYYQEYRGQPLNIGTQRHRLIAIRMLFKYLAAETLILVDPAATLELPKEPQMLPRVILTAREATKILESINVKTAMGLRDRAIIEVLYSSGIRASELVGLKLDNLDLEQGYLMVEQGKGNKDRVVPLGKTACHWIREYLQQARPKIAAANEVFLSMHKPYRPLYRKAIAEICAARSRQAGIKKKVTSHTFRHTCATLMLKGHADIRYIQELLGHNSLKSTQIYTKVTIQDLKKAHARCHPRDKG